MSSADHARSVNAHYGRRELGALVLEGLRAAGKDPERVSPADLAPVDQFHTRGRDATLELARLAGLEADCTVLDVGGGIGGAARTLAASLDAHVTVVDITADYCRVGADLTRRAGLDHRVRFCHASALDLPFRAAAFDAVLTQHSSMNIEDKARLYREIGRVLGPGGRLALHEIAAGAVQPVHFPVPWAREPSVSFLRPAEDVRRLIVESGFAEVAWVDQTAPSLEWFRRRVAAAGSGPPPPLGLHLLLGPDAPVMFANQVRNLEEARITVVQGVFRRA